MAKDKTIFTCSDCGGTTPRWLGKCPACGAWNTLIESTLDTGGNAKNRYTSQDAQHNERDRGLEQGKATLGTRASGMAKTHAFYCAARRVWFHLYTVVSAALRSPLDNDLIAIF